MIEVRTSGGRFETVDAGLRTRHSFSFGAHYDPADTGFASLVAHNDELLAPGTGYADHPHADTEIVSWVVSGALRHTSTVGSGVLGPGAVQRLSAGSGVVHREVADGVGDLDGPTRFVQAWVRPDQPGTTPSWESAQAVTEVGTGTGTATGTATGTGTGTGAGWTQLAGRGGAVGLGTSGARLYVATLRDGVRLELPDAPALHLFAVGAGAVVLGERRLVDGDAARLVDEGGRTVAGSGPQEAQVLVWAFDHR